LYGLGAVYGPLVFGWIAKRSQRVSKLLRWLETCFDRFGVPMIGVFPFYWLGVLAGTKRLPLISYAVAVFFGRLYMVLFIYYIGSGLADVTRVITAFFASHLWQSTLVAFGLIAVQQLFARRQKKQGQSLMIENMSD
jgi:uncharacterized membrane protein YdjX (TVP38/TMEM64 family)